MMKGMTKRVCFAVFLLLLFLLGVSFYEAFSGDAFLRGTDAYYYALQAKYWAKTGAVIIPDSSPIHRITGLLIRAGFSPEQAVRTWIATSLFLGYAIIAFVFFRWMQNLLNGVLFLALLASSTFLFTAVEFPKMFSMMIVLPIWFLPLLQESKRNRLRILFAISISALTVFLHRAALPLAVLFSAVVFIRLVWPFFQRHYKIFISTGLAFLLLLLVLFLSGKIPLRFLDLQRLSFNQPQMGILTLLERQSLPLPIKIELVLSLVLFVGVSVFFLKKARKNRADFWLVAVLLIPAFFPFGSEEVFGVGERYAIMLPYFTVWGALFLIARLSNFKTETLDSKRFENDLNQMHSVSGRKIKPAFLLFAFPFLLLLSTSKQRLNAAHPLLLDPDYKTYEGVVDELGQEPIPILIAHKTVAYFYKFKWMREAFPYEPEDHWNKERVWRLAYKIFPEELHYYLEEDCPWDSGRVKVFSNPDYFLVREDCWETMRAKISAEENSDLYERVWKTPLNPSQKRPAFLYPKVQEKSDEEFPALPQKYGSRN